MAASAAVTVPSTVAALAYFNARWRLPQDWRLLSSLARATMRFQRRVKADRVNSFYILEDQVNNPKVADKPFIVYGNKVWTFRETHAMSLRYAGWLHSTHNVAPGEYIAIDMMNSPQFLFLTLAIWSLGATPAFINYNLTGTSFVHSIRTAGARLLILDPEVASKILTDETREAILAPNFRNNAFPLEISILTPELTSSLAYFPPYRAPDSCRASASPRSPCGLISTSGTTGLPKAAIIPFERTSVASDTVGSWMQLRPVTHKHPDRYFTAMPLYHSSAFQLGFHMCLIRGVTFALSRKFSASHFWDEVALTKATVIQYVGETLRYLLAPPPSPNDRTKHSVRMAFGNGLRPDVWDKFRARFGVETIAEFYGATEGPAGTFNFSRNDFASGAMGSSGAIGTLLSNTVSAIVKVDWATEAPYRNPTTGFCERVKTGAPGELIFALDANDVTARFQGYKGNEKASEAKVLRNVFKTGDAYYRTGDTVNRDKEGRTYFVDRLGDTFRWKSENVSTVEVSEVLGHHPALLEANVYGVTIPGHEGRAGCAAILLRAEHNHDLNDALAESLATWNTNSLPKYAVPVFLRVVKHVMATGNNKQQKSELRKEGVEPGNLAGGDKIYWLRPGSAKYEPFGKAAWGELHGGRVKL